MERGESLAGAPGPAVDQRRLKRGLAGGSFWPLAALGLIGLCGGSAGLAQITPSQSLQQRLQEDQLRLRLLEFEDDDAVDGSAPLIQGASQSPLPWSGSLQLKTLELESTLPEIQALEQSLQGWIGRRIEADQLRQIEQQIEAWFWQRDQVVGIHRIAAEPESGVLRLAIAPLSQRPSVQRSPGHRLCHRRYSARHSTPARKAGIGPAQAQRPLGRAGARAPAERR